MTHLDPSGNAVPSLCESWEASSDAKTWRFKIRKGVEVHNCKTLTVDDVLASYAYEDNDANTHGDSRTIMASTASRKKDGDYLVVELEAPNADLPTLLSSYGLLIGPAGTEGSDWNQPGNGTGPFKIKDFNPGVRAEVERNPNHYRDDEGWFDSAEFINIQDQASRTNALRSDEVDVINRPDPKTTHLLAQAPSVKVVETPGNQHYTMPMRTDTDPFTDMHVRQTVKYAIPREEFLDKILNGYGYLGNDHPIGKGQVYFNKELPQRGFDADKAKWHLGKAGLSSLDIELFAAETAWAGALGAAQLAQEYAKRAGVNITVTRAAKDGYWSEIWLQKPWCLSYWGGRPTEDWMFSAVYYSQSGWNESYMKHDRFDELLLQARGELNPELRRAMYYEMQEILYNEGGSEIPVFSSYVLGMHERVQHSEISNGFDLDTFRIARHFWFA